MKVREYTDKIRECLNKIDIQFDKIQDIADNIRFSDNIYVCGNGGSSATASHFVNDLQKMCDLRAFCLTDNTPLVTAWANDTDYKMIFKEQLSRIINMNDSLILITGSGNSENILEAAEYGYENGLNMIAIVGGDGGKLINREDINEIMTYVHVQSEMLPFEDASLILCHIIASLIYENK
jgi:D-sedoheptulose 7-phosphate isomerase